MTSVKNAGLKMCSQSDLDPKGGHDQVWPGFIFTLVLMAEQLGVVTRCDQEFIGPMLGLMLPPGVLAISAHLYNYGWKFSRGFDFWGHYGLKTASEHFRLHSLLKEDLPVKGHFPQTYYT